MMEKRPDGYVAFCTVFPLRLAEGHDSFLKTAIGGGHPTPFTRRDWPTRLEDLRGPEVGSGV